MSRKYFHAMNALKFSQQIQSVVGVKLFFCQNLDKSAYALKMSYDFDCIRSLSRTVSAESGDRTWEDMMSVLQTDMDFLSRKQGILDKEQQLLDKEESLSQRQKDLEEYEKEVSKIKEMRR